MLPYAEDEAFAIPAEAFDDERSAILYMHGIVQNDAWQFRAWAVSDRRPDINLPAGRMHTKVIGEPNQAINSAVEWTAEACDSYDLCTQVIDTYACVDAAMVVVGVVSKGLTWKFERVEGLAQEACEQALVDFPH